MTLVPGSSGLHDAWDWNGVIGTGQSLAVGVQAGSVVSREASHHNLKLDLGNRVFPATDPNSDRLRLVPLREPVRWLAWRYPAPYPRNVFGQTPHTSMASQITSLFLAASGGAGDYVSVHSVVGESGQPMVVISKGARRTEHTGHAYEASLFETRAIARLARQAGHTFGVAAVVLTHGEADAESKTYEGEILKLWRDYDRDLAAITGQQRSIALLLTQQSSSPTVAGSVAFSALAAWRASQARPDDVVCVGPQYQYSYAADGVHLDALGYQRLGEKYGQAYFERIVKGAGWRPLSPRGVEAGAGVIAVEFVVPHPPLSWDDRLPPPHQSGRSEWARGRGFELSLDGAPVTIEGVELQGERVLIRHGAPLGGALLLRYAATANEAPRAGGARRWGQLRDSDPFVGASSGTAQPNYAVSFELQVP